MLEGVDVLGIVDGFEWLMRGNTDHVRPLTIESVSRIHFRGGSFIGIARANPTKDPALLENTVTSLQRLGVSQLVTIGGDDTAFSAMKLQRALGRTDRASCTCRRPSTTTSTCRLSIDTFGFQTARHVGAEIVKNLMVDAHTTSRWYFVVSMGRKAGHLALGMGKAAGATLTLIPEEFGTTDIRFNEIVDTLLGAIIKRRSLGQRHGVAVIAEGVVEGIRPADLAELDDRRARRARPRAHLRGGHRRDSQTRGGGAPQAAQDQDDGRRRRTSATSCAAPIRSRTTWSTARDLGYCAAKYLIEGGSGVMVSMQAGHFVPIPFAQLLDPATGRTRVRLVDIHSARYAIARRYMIRLRRDDFDDPQELAKFAATAGMTLEEFRQQFAYLVEREPPPLQIGPIGASS